MKKFFLIFIFFFSGNLLISANYYFLDFYPDVSPVNKFASELVSYINSVDNSSKFINIRDKNIFKSSSQILDALQSNVIQIAVIPAYTINNSLQNPLKDINYKSSNTIIEKLMIPYREKLRDYGLFLLDIFYFGRYSFFTTVKPSNSKLLIGTLFPIKFENKNIEKSLIIDETANVKGLIKSGILNALIITPIQFYNFKLTDSKIKYKTSIKNLYSYLIVVANETFWDSIDFNVKSVIWSYITNYHSTFQSNYSKLNVFIKNLLTKKLIFY